MKEPKHTPEWQNLLNDAADKFVTNHKDEEVRRMYGHHFRSFVEGAVWEFERNVNNFEKMKEALEDVRRHGLIEKDGYEALVGRIGSLLESIK